MMRATFQTIIAISLSLFMLASGCVIPAMLHLNQGDSYAKQGRVEEAISEYNQAIEFNPKFSSAYKARGLIYFDQGQWAPAVTDLSKAIELAPKFTNELSPKLAVAYGNHGHDYLTQGLYDSAITDLTKAIELDPDSATARIYADRGKAYLETGQSAAARNDYNRAIELDPQLLTGQDLADIIYRGASKTTTASVDLDATLIIVISEGGTLISVKMPMKMSGAFDIANKKMRMNMSFSVDIPGQGKQELSGDVYVVNGWEYINLEDSGGEDWLKMECDEAMWAFQDELPKQRELLNTAMDVTLLGSEKIDDIDCYVLLFKPDMAELPKLLNNLLSQQQQTQTEFSQFDWSKMLKEVEIKEWITKDEYLPVKIDGNMILETAFYEILPESSSVSLKDMNLKMDFTMQAKFGDYNKPVIIDLPPEALRARELSEFSKGY